MKGFGGMRLNKKLSPEQIHVNLARLKKNGRNFEVVVEPDKAVAYKDGAITDIREVLMAEHIFENAKKGVFSAKTDLKITFGTLDEEEIAEFILRKGELQLSSKYRDQKQDDKRRRILEIIHRTSINPTNNLPHPIVRLENAFDEAKIRVSDKLSAEDQIQGILKKLKPIIPIKQENKSLQIHLSEKYAKKYFRTIHNYGKISKERWLSDGDYSCVIEIPAGIYLDLVEDLSKKTHGGVEIKVLSEKNKRFYQ
jgi:ribosome maturation protein SDO1